MSTPVGNAQVTDDHASSQQMVTVLLPCVSANAALLNDVILSTGNFKSMTKAAAAAMHGCCFECALRGQCQH
jgi:hypothetical protein